MKDIYQLHATGQIHPDTGITGRIQTVSRITFTDRNDAISYIPTFRESCITRKSGGDTSYMNPDTIDIKVVELILKGITDES